ncbi:MAG: hypothetical protein KAW41_03885 [Candidatus Diapherotrites archaeon]|nr:hypothetical protein [Candidatus Diapherotrites archaeon]
MLFGIWYRLKALEGLVHPTYGNTMYHTGIIRAIVETGFMPVYDLSYGGFTKSFYVPAYRLFTASVSSLSGTDPIVSAGLMVVALGAVSICAIYLLGKEFGGPWAGACCAILFVLSPELTIYTIRPFPEVLGVPMLLLALYFVKKQDLGMAVLASVLTALTHQTSAAVLGSVLLVYSVLARDKKAAVALLSMFVAYFAWQLYALNSLDIFSMRQIALKESGKITLMHVERIGLFALLAAPIGAIKAVKKRHWLLASFAIAALLLAKNEWLGIGIFNDRLFTFLALAVVVLGGVGLAELGKMWGEAK